MSYKTVVWPNIWSGFLPCGKYLYFCGLCVKVADKHKLVVGLQQKRVMLYMDVHCIIFCRVAWDGKLLHQGIGLYRGVCGVLYVENWGNHKCCARGSCCE